MFFCAHGSEVVRAGANCRRKDTNAQNFVTNHFVLRSVNSMYGMVAANRKPSA
jgi:hypothetical protein